MAEEERERRNHDLISRYLGFYEALRTKARRPKTAAQRRFQDVAWGLSEPETDHEIAYVDHLTKIGRPPGAPPIVNQRSGEEADFPEGARPVPHNVGQKWDAAAENMRGWRPWKD
jgi:hypothetical protein